MTGQRLGELNVAIVPHRPHTASALGGGLALCYAVTPQPIKLPMAGQGRRAGFYASIGSK